MRSSPSRALPRDAVWILGQGIGHLIGGRNVIRYFFPRLFEVACEDPRERVEYALLALSWEDWRGWPVGEARAVHQALVALWRFRLALEPGIGAWPEVNELFRLLSETFGDPEPLLAAWRVAEGDAPTWNLAQWVLAISKGKSGLTWLPEAIQSFLRAENTRRKLLEVARTSHDVVCATECAVAAEALSCSRTG